MNLTVLGVVMVGLIVASSVASVSIRPMVWLAALFALAATMPRIFQGRPATDWLRAALSLVVLIAAYESLGPMIAALDRTPRDSWIIIVERLATAGRLPPLAPLALAPALVDTLNLAYVAYFLLPPALLAALLRRGQTVDAEHALLTLLVAFYVHYLIYVIVPVVGPFRTADLPDSLRVQLGAGGGSVSRHVRAVVGSLEGTEQDAFPSAHASVTCLVVALAWKRRLPLRWWAAAAAGPILASTVLLGYHYIVDVVASAPVAWLAWCTGQWVSLPATEQPADFGRPSVR